MCPHASYGRRACSTVEIGVLNLHNDGAYAPTPSSPAPPRLARDHAHTRARAPHATAAKRAFGAAVAKAHANLRMLAAMIHYLSHRSLAEAEAIHGQQTNDLAATAAAPAVASAPGDAAAPAAAPADATVATGADGSGNHGSASGPHGWPAAALADRSLIQDEAASQPFASELHRLRENGLPLLEDWIVQTHGLLREWTSTCCMSSAVGGASDGTVKRGALPLIYTQLELYVTTRTWYVQACSVLWPRYLGVPSNTV